MRYEIEDDLWCPDDVLDLFGVENLPVPVIGMAKGMDIDVYYRPDAEFEGMVYFDIQTGKSKIFVDKDQNPMERRFTVAHELAHLVLHKHHFVDEAGGPKLVHRDYSQDFYLKSGVQGEANKFAVRLLTPAWLVDFAVSRVTADIGQLAREFGVQQEILKWRLHDLGFLT